MAFLFYRGPCLGLTEGGSRMEPRREFTGPRRASNRRGAEMSQLNTLVAHAGPVGDPELPPWLENLTIELTASPDTVTYGDPCVVSWSVVQPGPGPELKIRLNGESVAASGSRSFIPPRKKSFTLRVSGMHLGVPAETTRTVQVRVKYCPTVVIDPNTPEPVQVA